MNLLDFFTSHKTEPPVITPFAYILLMMSLVSVIYVASRYFEQKKVQTFFRVAQIVQLVSLYGWYLAIQEPLSESLPLYHCRVAMFAVLLLPDKVAYKQYFALLGVFGPICAIVYPILDPYPFPHITLFSFFIGHLALLGNSIIYLMKYYDRLNLSYRRIVEITFGLDFLILLGNIAFGGNYGFLKEPPLVGDHGMLGNYLIVSMVLATALLIFSYLFKEMKERQAERLIQ